MKKKNRLSRNLIETKAKYCNMKVYKMGLWPSSIIITKSPAVHRYPFTTHTLPYITLLNSTLPFPPLANSCLIFSSRRLHSPRCITTSLIVYSSPSLVGSSSWPDVRTHPLVFLRTLWTIANGPTMYCSTSTCSSNAPILGFAHRRVSTTRVHLHRDLPQQSPSRWLHKGLGGDRTQGIYHLPNDIPDSTCL